MDRAPGPVAKLVVTFPPAMATWLTRPSGCRAYTLTPCESGAMDTVFSGIGTVPCTPPSCEFTTVTLADFAVPSST